MRKALIAVICGICMVSFMGSDVVARGGGRGRGSEHSSSIGSGTGSHDNSHSVHGYFRKDGTSVAPHHHANPDHNFYNNWLTKPHVNTYTGAEGTRLTPVCSGN